MMCGIRLTRHPADVLPSQLLLRALHGAVQVTYWYPVTTEDGTYYCNWETGRPPHSSEHVKHVTAQSQSDFGLPMTAGLTLGGLAHECLYSQPRLPCIACMESSG